MKYTITELRARHRMSQSELAEMVNLSLPTIGKYEADPRKATVATLEKIAQALGVEMEDIFLGENIKNNNAL